MAVHDALLHEDRHILLGTRRSVDRQTVEDPRIDLGFVGEVGEAAGRAGVGSCADLTSEEALW